MIDAAAEWRYTVLGNQGMSTVRAYDLIERWTQNVLILLAQRCYCTKKCDGRHICPCEEPSSSTIKARYEAKRTK